MSTDRFLWDFDDLVFPSDDEKRSHRKVINKARAEVLVRLRKKIGEGGAGSGNFGHAGRPGKVGGSTTEYSTPTYFETPDDIKLRDIINNPKHSEKIRDVTPHGITRPKIVDLNIFDAKHGEFGAARTRVIKKEASPADEPLNANLMAEEVVGRISTAMGLDLVPPGIFDEKNGAYYSKIVEGKVGFDLNKATRDNEYNQNIRDQANLCQFFNWVVGNPDDHEFNTIYDEDSQKIWSIDHSRCFGWYGQNGVSYWEHAEMKLTDDMRTCCMNFVRNEQKIKSYIDRRFQDLKAVEHNKHALDAFKKGVITMAWRVYNALDWGWAGARAEVHEEKKDWPDFSKFLKTKRKGE